MKTETNNTGVIDLRKNNNMTALKNHLADQIENMSSDELMALNNAYCESAHYDGDTIYENDDTFLEENFSSISEAVRAATYGEYNFSHSHVKFNGYANLESLDGIGTDDLVETVSTIVSYAIDNQSDFLMLDFDFEEEEAD